MSKISRLRRVRVAWFVFGGVCGVVIMYALQNLASIQHDTHSSLAQELVPLEQPVQAYPADSGHSPAAATASENTFPDDDATDLVQATETAGQDDAKPLHGIFPAAISLRVGSGDTLLTILTDTGISYEEAHQAVTAIRKIYDPRKLDVGLQVALNLDPSANDPNAPVIRSLSLPVSKTAVVELQRAGDGNFAVKKVETPLIKKVVHLEGSIRGSFYQTGAAVGIPVDALNSLIKTYSYDVDFQRDIQRGDRLDVLMERLETDTGVVAGYGNVLYASLDLGERRLAVYRHKDKSGTIDFYNEKGESLRKALLRTPINGARITSGFGMRMHPILGYSKMHRGADFGALNGTPIYAAGDGVVDMAGWNGAYGNYVRIKHDGKYATAYGHASRIASGIKPGVRVKQGQVVAYVGSTGRSTGPHLHYEVLVNGSQVNPAGIKFKTGNTLTGKELASFKTQVAQVKLALKDGGEKKVAAR